MGNGVAPSGILQQPQDAITAAAAAAQLAAAAAAAAAADRQVNGSSYFDYPGIAPGPLQIQHQSQPHQPSDHELSFLASSAKATTDSSGFTNTFRDSCSSSSSTTFSRSNDTLAGQLPTNHITPGNTAQALVAQALTGTYKYCNYI